MADEKKQYPRYDFKASTRVTYANIVKPRAFQGKGDPKYSAQFLLAPDSEDLKAIQALCGAALKEQYPGKRLKAGRLTEEQDASGEWVEVVMPWQDGTKLADKAKAEGKNKNKEAMRGFVVLKAGAPMKNPPALAMVLDGKIVDLNDAETRAMQEKYFYSGAYVAPYVAVATYKAQDGKPGGANLYLNGVLFVKHGERIGGVNLAEVFKGHIGKASTVDPGTNALDDEIPY